MDRGTAEGVLAGIIGPRPRGEAEAIAMRAAYPVAMNYLDSADRSARAGRDLRTYGGRLVRMSGAIPEAAASGGVPGEGRAARADAARAAARGRYGRNALVQGAAAEFFKMWAVTVRARSLPLNARIVLCLHDELLVHVPAECAPEAATLVSDCLAETARRWAPAAQVRFIASLSIVRSWADAK